MEQIQNLLQNQILKAAEEKLDAEYIDVIHVITHLLCCKK